MVRKQKNFEEKIIDDFAICAFKTWDDLQAASISSLPSEEDIEEAIPHKIKSKKKLPSPPCSSNGKETDKNVDLKDKLKTTFDDAIQKAKSKKKLLSPPCSSSKKKSDKDVDLKEKHKTAIDDPPQKIKSKKKILSPPCSPDRNKHEKDADLKEKHKSPKDLNEILRKTKTLNKASSKEKLKLKREHKHNKSKTIKSDCCSDHQPKRKKPKKEPSTSSSRSETASNDSCTNEEINDGESKSDDHELQVSSTISTGSISSSTVVTIKTSTTTKSCKVSNHTSSTSRSSISILNQPLSETPSQPSSSEPKCTSTSTTTSTSATTATTTTNAARVIDSTISSSKNQSPPLPSPPVVLSETNLPQHSSPVISPVSSRTSARPCCSVGSRPQSPVNSNMVTITNESSTVMKTTKVTGRATGTPTGSSVSRIPTNTATLTASQSMTSKAMTTKLQSIPMQSHNNNYREDETVARRHIPVTNIGNNFNPQQYPILPPSFSGHSSTAHTASTSTSNKNHQEFFRLEELRSRKDSHIPMQDGRSYNHNNSSMQHTRPPMTPLQSFGPVPCKSWNASQISTNTPHLTVPSSLSHFSPSINSKNKQQSNSMHQISPIRNEPARPITSGNIHQSPQLNGYPSVPTFANGPSYHPPILSDYIPSTRVEHNPSLVSHSDVKRELGERFLANQMEKFAATLPSYATTATMHPGVYQQHQSSLISPAFSGQPSICITDTISRHSTTSIIPAPPTGGMGFHGGSMVSQTATSRFDAISNMSVDMGMHQIAQPLPSPYNQHHNLYPPNLAQRETTNHLGGYPFSSSSMLDPYTIARYKAAAAAVDSSILYDRAFSSLSQFNPNRLTNPIQPSPYAVPPFRPPTHSFAGVYVSQMRTSEISRNQSVIN